MKYIIKCATVAFVSLVAVSCSNGEDPIGGAIKQPMSFAAAMGGGPSARQNVSGRRYTHLVLPTNAVHFDAGDAISIFDGVNNNCRFETQDNGASALFEGEAVGASTYTALYPYQEGAKLNGTTLTAYLPEVQIATAGTYDPLANLSVATTSNAEKSFYFKNVCALIKFTLPYPMSKVVFYGSNNEKISGNLSISVSDAPSATGDSEEVALVGANGGDMPAGTYYLAVLPQTFNKGLGIGCYKAGKEDELDFSCEYDFSFTMQRAYIYDMGTLMKPIEGPFILYPLIETSLETYNNWIIN